MSTLRLPSSESEDEISKHENYQKFFEFWLSEQTQYLETLISAAKIQNQSGGSGSSEEDDDVEALIDRVIQHYEHYYKIKSYWVEHDALSVLTPSWKSSFEDAFLWIGGWRPTMAFHLLYSKSGLQLEVRLMDVVRGSEIGDLADLSPEQVKKVDKLQRQTIKEEKEITEKMAKHQETIADPAMVELSHIVTSSIMEGKGGEELSEIYEKVKSELKHKEEGLKKLAHMADELRLRTLKGILQILKKIQAIHFLIAAAELHSRIHEWGLQMQSDARQQQQP